MPRRSASDPFSGMQCDLSCMMWRIQKGQVCLFIMCLCGMVLTAGVPVSAVQEPMGYFEVTSSPQGADVVVDGIFAGETPVIIPVRTMNPNGSVIRVMMQGFQIWEQTYTKNPLKGEVTPVQAVLEPVATVGSLRVSSIPSGAMVMVDNGNGQMTPWAYQNLPTGTHLVSLFLLGFDPFVRTIEIQPGRTTELVANMTTRSGSGSLQISSEPGGGSAYVDGVYVGITNLVVGNIPPGHHEVRISRAGNDDYVEWASVQDKGTTLVQAKLKPVSETSGGFVVVTSEPPGATVYIDGEFSGMTETGRSLEISNITPGTHRIYISSKNYEDYEAVILVSAGAITPVSVRMDPSPMPQACGILILNSEPSGAEITIDGQLRGATPATIETVCSGKHTFSLSLAGYQDYRSQVDLIPGQVLQINTVMTPEAGAAETPRKETPWPDPLLIIILVAGVGFILRRL
ncbi:MAG: PEGA domain-containing protein [Methanobacteriota archaeon]